MKTGKRNGTGAGFPLWINRDRRILSFHEAVGFERREFGSRKEMLAYAYRLAGAGFRIQ